MAILSITSHSEQETFALGKRLASSFKAGDLIVLEGQLGAGKTVFVRGLAAGLGLDEQLISSPSFGLVNEYPGEIPLYHFDLYRVNDMHELYEIGWEEYLSRNGVVVVEWGERAEEHLPRQYYKGTFTIASDEVRVIDISLVQT